jgi:hypothetical protein
LGKGVPSVVVHHWFGNGRKREGIRKKKKKKFFKRRKKEHVQTYSRLPRESASSFHSPVGLFQQGFVGTSIPFGGVHFGGAVQEQKKKKKKNPQKNSAHT